MRAPARTLMVATLSVLLTSGLVAASAQASPGDREVTSVARQDVPLTAVGLIVRTSRSTPTATDLDRIATQESAAVDDTALIDRGLVTVPFEEPLPASEAVERADAMADLPGVKAAEPDYLLQIAATSPVRPNDQYFDQLYGVWDSRTFAGFPTGGYSVRAPSLWRATKGSPTVRVAVIDTGITSHPDLAPNVVAGYDFTSIATSSGGSGGDPFDRDQDKGPTKNGWDSNPADPGDWVGANECGFGWPASPRSSWHGTHVAGTIAAVDDNAVGVTGVAPDVRIQPIRALGPCGGTTSDIATAIKWAAGAPIPGVKANATPARVINLSLGGSASCGPTFQGAVDVARSLGATVVAAAGNEGSQPVGSPANCSGVVAVAATDEYGQRTTYTNLGTSTRRADVAAPGGDAGSDGLPANQSAWHGVLSTYNTGTTTPGTSTYAFLNGTSMATPHVAGGAALLYSLGYSRPQVETALRTAVRPFPRYGNGSVTHPFPYTGIGGYDCTSSLAATGSQRDCGRGILDLARVPALYGPTSIAGTPRVGQVLTTQIVATRGTVRYQWYRDGRAISGATRATYRAATADRGHRLTVRATVGGTGFRTQTATTSPLLVQR